MYLMLGAVIQCALQPGKLSLPIVELTRQLLVWYLCQSANGPVTLPFALICIAGADVRKVSSPMMEFKS